MSEALPKMHDAAGGSHRCLFCRKPYWCDEDHMLAGLPVLEGMRCCYPCAAQNMVDARKLRMGGES